MFIRKYWILLSVLLVAIVGVGLYLLTTQPEKEPIVIIKPVEPLPKSERAAEAPVVESSQGGRVHADGTFPAEPHETPVQPPVEINSQQVSDPPRPGVSTVSPRRLPEDVFSAEYTAQVKAAVQTCVSLFHSSEEERKAGGYTEYFWMLMEAWNDANRLSDLAYRMNNPSYEARADEIYALQEPFDALIPRPKLTAEQLAQLEKAAREFDVLNEGLSPAAKQQLRDLGLENPYRTRLEEEKN